MVNKYLTLASIPLLAASLNAQAVTVDQLNRQVQKLNQRISEQGQRFRVNGFASFGISKSDEEMAYNDVSDETSFNRFSKVGIQMTFNMDAQNSVVTQLVSRGESGWDTSAEWAYFKHEFSANFSAKIGRIRLPAYQLSEFIDVGYAVPYALNPAETYDSLAPFANMDGVDLSYTMDVGDNTASFQLTYGRAKDDEFDLKDLFGSSVNFQTDTWNARLSYGWSSLQVGSDDLAGAIGLYGGDTAGIDASFTSLGFTYDPGEIYFTTEFTKLEVDGEIVDADALYATIGYRIGRYMPFLTFATAESTDDNERDTSQLTVANTGALALASAVTTAVAGGATEAQAITAVAASATGGDEAIVTAAVAGAPQIVGGIEALKAASNRNTQRIGIGLRYDMSPGTALKIQYDIITVEDESGLFDDTAWATNAASGGTNPDGANILTITIDTVF